MASCSICGMDGLEWSENRKPKTGKQFLYSTNTGMEHNCVERVFCFECNIVFSSFEKGWRHMMTTPLYPVHRIVMWDVTKDDSKNHALELGVPLQVIKRK